MFDFCPIVVHEGDVYYVPDTHKFIQVREYKDGIYTISEGTDFYSDAKTHIGEIPVSKDYISGLVKVEAIDTLPGVKFDKVGWRWVGP